MITAREAKARTQQAINAPVTKMMEQIEEAILEAADKKLSCTHWFFNIEDFNYMEQVIFALRANGYEVKETADVEDAAFIKVFIYW